LAYPIKGRMEDRTLRIPLDPKIRADLRMVTKQTTAAGNIRFTAERTPDGHADHFWALGLAVHAASQPGVVIDYQSTNKQRASSDTDGYRGHGGSSSRTNSGGFR